VASTKSFLTQITALYMLAVAFGQKRGVIDAEKSRKLLRDLLLLPGEIEKALSGEEAVKSIAKEYSRARGFIYLGRGINYPIALEGALKLKEISYIHAEGYPAGEMKHGPIALIDDALPAVFLVSKDALFGKMISNIQEVKSRGGDVIIVATEGSGEVSEISQRCIFVPEANSYLSTALFAVPLQLLAYHIGVLRGCDVDQPRNLAKSVTVE
jgi:glucosamine--fructose-6-phosphate aminotransferase (isomerizing)